MIIQHLFTIISQRLKQKLQLFTLQENLLRFFYGNLILFFKVSVKMVMTLIMVVINFFPFFRESHKVRFFAVRLLISF